jgi:hypothetical protein
MGTTNWKLKNPENRDVDTQQVTQTGAAKRPEIVVVVLVK